MKVSIMTLIGIENYGSLLQAFATQKKMEEYADDVELINCIQNTRFIDLITVTRNPIKMFFQILSAMYIKCNFNRFKHNYLKLTSKSYVTEEDFAQFQDDADIYFTGSDQIWNPDCVPEMFSGARYLGFIPEGKRKFAYASSFGEDRISEDAVFQSQKFIKQFECISTRESSGLKILKEQYGYHNAVQLVDPTLAMPPKFWRKYAPSPIIKKDYILIYGLVRTNEFNMYAKELSKRTGLPLVRLCHRFAQIFLCGKSVLMPPVFDAITLFDNAKYVLTDSFHGAAFSFNLNTEPICVYQARPGRLSSLLNLLGAEHRAIRDFNDFDILNRPTDFASINEVLARERERVDKYLKKIFYKDDSLT